MRYEALKKLATPGPFERGHGRGTCFHEGNLDCIVHLPPVESAGDEQQEYTVCEFWPTDNPKVAEADAMLFLHCRTHFDEVVSALEGCVTCAPNLLHTPVGRRALDVLARAKEVK